MTTPPMPPQEEPFLNPANRARLSLRLTPVAEIFVYPFAVGLAAALLGRGMAWELAGPLQLLALATGPAGVLWFRYKRVAARAAWLKNQLRNHLERRERLPAGFDGHFVGYAPGGALAQYDGMVVQDLGFVTLRGPWLLYVGDQQAFAIHQGEVAGVKPGYALPDYYTTPGSLLTLTRPGVSKPLLAGFFSAEGTDANDNRRHQQHLTAVLEQWRATPQPGDPTQPPLGLPALCAPTQPGVPLQKTQMITTLLVTGLVAGFLSLVPGLLMGLRWQGPGLPPALLAPLATFTAVFFATLPILVWRQKPESLPPG